MVASTEYLMNSSDTTDGSKVVRVFGISEFPAKLENGRVLGKAGEIYNELNHGEFKLVDHLVPRLKGLSRQINRIRSFSPNISEWRHNIALSPAAFDTRTRLIEDYINALEEPFDVVFQMLAIFAPGTEYKNRKYAVCTDNTFLLSKRYWPEWAPIKNQRRYQEWLARETALFQNATYLFPWGRHVGQSMIEDYGVAPEKVIPVGMSGNLPPALPEDVAQHQYDGQLALFVGYEFERKGGHILLEAWKEVQRQLPKARLIIAGPDKPEADPLPGVEWIGRTGQDKLIELFKQATVFVMPSYFEPWGHVFHEAMSYGVPCIGADICAMPEFIHDGQNGALVPVGDSQALANRLVTILKDSDHAAALGQNAYQTFNDHYTWEKIADRIKPHLKKAVL